jgi:hypothetical protein
MLKNLGDAIIMVNLMMAAASTPEYWNSFNM